MRKEFFYIFSLCFFVGFAQDKETIFKKLKKHYPIDILSLKDNKLFFKDGSFLIFDDGKRKNTRALLENPDIEDMFLLQYVDFDNPKKTDAGRIRNDTFFKKIYGQTKFEVEKNLVEIIWCPKLINQIIKVTAKNGVASQLKKVSDELDEIPDLKKYLSNIGGTFNWRKIAGTNRQSLHSYGMTIDINVQFSDYWQWTCKCKNENTFVKYSNKIEKKIVDVFAKYGFIWGGNWQHFDTMHFEYRPELLSK